MSRDQRLPDSAEMHGFELLHDPRKNKGTAFTAEERDRLGLRGLLPPRTFDQHEQAGRVLENFRAKPNSLEQYIFLTSLQDRNETLFYRVVMDNVEEMLPVIYTPTVGEACRRFSQIYRRPMGLYVTIEDRGSIVDVLHNWPQSEIDVIVVTDGERILGLGDLGAQGMGIPAGKLALYTALAGVHPHRCLPITLDVGTNNQELRGNPLYIGLQRERARGAEYDDFIGEFVDAVFEVFPDSLLQFEDFATTNAIAVLDRYRNEVRCFNDDIQGTASVTLAGLYSSERISGRDITEERLLFFGAGSAATGIGHLIASAMVSTGADRDGARSNLWFVDSKGLVVASREDLAPHKRPFAHDHEFLPDLLSAIEAVRPTGIIGVSGQPGSFDRTVVEAMAGLNKHPIVFALSNPTSKSECTAEDAYRWSDGRAIFASGSPFDPVEIDGRRHVPSQGNNAYIFPGVGLGVIATRAREVTDEMFAVAARALADSCGREEVESRTLYPRMNRIREVSLSIATAVAEEAFRSGLAVENRPGDLQAHIQGLMYEPTYPDYSGS